MPRKKTEISPVVVIQEKVHDERDLNMKLANILSMVDKNLIDTAKDFMKVVNVPILRAEEDVVMAYFKKLMVSKDNSRTSVRVKMYRLQKIYNLAMSFGERVSNPVTQLLTMKLITLPKPTMQKREININDSKRDIFLKSPKVSEKTKAIVEFLTITALRVSEFTSIRLSDCRDFFVNRDGQLKKFVEIKVFSTKTNQEGVVYVDRAKFYRLKKSMRTETDNSESDYLVTNCYGHKITRQGIDTLIRGAWYNLFGEKMSAHQMRHFFATNKLESGMNIYEVSQCLRHRSIKTTADVYSHATIKPTSFDIGESEEDEIFDEELEIDDAELDNDDIASEFSK